MQRNVVTLSNIPPNLHEWLKHEAARLSEETGERVRIYQVVTTAIEQYKARHEQPAAAEREVANVANG